MAMMLSLLIVVFVLCAAGGVAVRMARADSRAMTPDEPGRSWLPIVVVTAVAVLSLLMVTLVPPMQSPDENSHLQRAYSLADGQFLIAPNSRMQPENQDVDAGLRSYIETWQYQLATKQGNRVTPAVEGLSRQISFAGEEVRVMNGAAPYFPVLYAPASAGLALAQKLGEPVWIGAIWARLGMWLVSMVAFALALTIARAGRNTLMATGLLPMTLAQFGSVNLDAMTISMGVLAVALLTSGILGGAASDSFYPRWQRWGVWVLLALLALTKPLFVAFLIPVFVWAVWRQGNRLHLVVIAAIGAVLLGWMAHMANNFVDARIAHSGSTFSNLLTAVASPIDTAGLVARTLHTNADFYWQTMIGRLGWLDTPLTGLLYGAGGWLLAGGVISDALSGNRSSLRDRSIYLASTLAFIAAAFLIMLAAWTPSQSQVIEGVQGRYFLPALPLAAAALGLSRPRWPCAASSVMALVVLFYLVVLLLELPRILLYRFWL